MRMFDIAGYLFLIAIVLNLFSPTKLGVFRGIFLDIALFCFLLGCIVLIASIALFPTLPWL